jgi:DHA1 family bicyclomycin/chloramphenicol resistance-like MFS transporter
MFESDLDDPVEDAFLGATCDRPIDWGRSSERFSTAVRLLIVLLGALAGMGPLAIDLYLPGFPAMAAEFNTSVPQIERTLAAYFVGLSLGQLVYGPLSDAFGRKRPLYFGLVLFMVASALCAMTQGVVSLITLRFVQALGGCAEMVIARAIVRDRFETRDATRVFSSLILIMGLAPILAPLMGGWMVVHIGWRAIFWFLAGFGALCLICAAAFLPETHPPERRERHDLAGLVKQYAALLSHRTFMAYTLSASLISAGLFAYVGGCSFVFMELFGVRPERFGLYFGANAFGLISASQINGQLVRRMKPERVLRVALAVSTISGIVLLLVATTRWGGFAGVLVPLFCFIASLGFVFPTSTALAMAPHGRAAGNASAVLGCLQFLVSGVGGMLVSTLHNGTAVPMAGLIAVGSFGALIANRFARES